MIEFKKLTIVVLIMMRNNCVVKDRVPRFTAALASDLDAGRFDEHKDLSSVA